MMAMRKENVLIVDDDYDMLELLHRHLRAMEFHTYRASSVHEAIEILQGGSIDLLITDLQMPGINGLELIRYAREHYPEIPKLVVTGFPTVDNAVGAIKAGALEFLSKPFTGEELRSAIRKSIAETAPALSNSSGITSYAGMTGHSPHFRNMVDVIERVKDNRATILITGESGTGKELVARAIHFEGAFASGPFIAVNCGALPEHWLASELFGCAKGSFTGANEARAGLFEKADGGTIFLDEIGNAPLNVQARMLRVLQEREVSRIGESHARPVSIRIIAATNADLSRMVASGAFREDLYYRLNVVNIETPPLRDRPQDIVPLAEMFIRKYSTEFSRPAPAILPDARTLLERHSWPGNVRELENVIQRLVILHDGDIGIQALPENLKYAIEKEGQPLQPLREVERDHIMKVLSHCGNNKTRAAEILGIDRKTLRLKLGENG